MITTPHQRDRIALIPYLSSHVVAVPLLLGAIALYAHDSGLDFRIEDAFFDPLTMTFPWRASTWLESVGHHLVKLVPIGICLLAIGAAIASAWVSALRPWRAVLWSLVAALCIGPSLITQLKQITAPPCPWDLKRYGGYAEIAVTWLARSHSEAGQCLPSGHAGAGYSLFALYFAGWAIGRPRWRWLGLIIGIIAGSVFGLVRMLQGAHFVSHVAWSALVDWLTASLVFLPLLCVRQRSDHDVVSPSSAVTS